MIRSKAIASWQWAALILLRVIIGWHFLYEGIAKLFNPYWSSAPYLVEAKWFLSNIFTMIVTNPQWLKVVDILNISGQIAIGLGLMIGFLTTPACIAGLILLALYYLANPPLVGFKSSMPVEGSYLIVNKNLVEFASLLVLSLFPTGRVAGLDRLVFGPLKSQVSKEG
ncbi:MAG: DoxX family membrane protein [Candidatus Aminicenantes bacterium]|nr:DoxX family membrane protein [Candidatus Aminicenantes bacterium]